MTTQTTERYISPQLRRAILADDGGNKASELGQKGAKKRADEARKWKRHNEANFLKEFVDRRDPPDD